MNLFIQLKNCSHNINGIKNSKPKFLNLLDWLPNKPWIKVSETNLMDIEHDYLIPDDSDYMGVWMGQQSQQNQRRHSHKFKMEEIYRT